MSELNETMTKRELVDRIRALNPTAEASFLATFDEEDLLAYLHQLSELNRELKSKKHAEPVAV